MAADAAADAVPPTAREGETEGHRRAGARWVALACALILAAFALVSAIAIHGKCATMDEPLHAVGAYVLAHDGDFRIDFEDPPLWQRFAALAEPAGSLKVNLHDDQFRNTLQEERYRQRWVREQLYTTTGNDADRFVGRVRLLMVSLGMALGALVAWWSWKLAGAVAAVAATLLFALDPTVLAHSAVVKNDVAISLVAAALAFVTWRAGQRLTLRRGVLIAVLCATAMVTKFSGPLVVIACAAVPLIVRAVLPTPWVCLGRALRHRATRLLAVVCVLFVSGALSYAVLWASYSFRYAPDPAGGQWDFQPMMRYLAIIDSLAHHPNRRAALYADVQAWRPNALVRSVLALSARRLVPQTWAYGMLYTYGGARVRDSFLLGDYNTVGFPPWYFPLAYLFKTPLATLVAILLAVIAGIGAWFSPRKTTTTLAAHDATPGSPAWSACALAIPFVIMLAADLSAHLNIGIRHLLPLYPFLYVGVGCAAARIWKRWGRNGRVLLGGLAVALAIETAASFPNYIPFFNAACDGPTRHLHLLGDSNLDWGQDLPLLAKWQREHPDRRLYLCYFGAADPAYYGIRYEPLPYTQSLHDPSVSNMPTEPGVIAISGTALQAIHSGPEARQLYSPLMNAPPLDVLGGSIYLYEYEPR